MHRRMTKSFFAVLALVLVSGCASSLESPGAVDTLRTMRERGPCHVHVAQDVATCRSAI